MPVVPTRGNKSAVGTGELAAIKRVAEDAEESSGQFLLGKEFKAQHFSFAILPHRFISNSTKFCPLVRQTDSICGADISNQELPYRSIVEYDARNNTSTIYGFGDGQVIAPREILVKTIFDTITNSKVTIEFDLAGNIDFIGSDVLDWNNPEEWFDTPENTRRTMENIWAKAKNSQINEIVFAAIEDACAYIQDMTHLIKTSRLSAYSIRIINPSPATEDFE
jgi:hypothetical protein